MVMVIAVRVISSSLSLCSFPRRLRYEQQYVLILYTDGGAVVVCGKLVCSWSTPDIDGRDLRDIRNSRQFVSILWGFVTISIIGWLLKLERQQGISNGSKRSRTSQDQSLLVDWSPLHTCNLLIAQNGFNRTESKLAEFALLSRFSIRPRDTCA